MANEIEHVATTGLTFYAKPTPIVDTPWGGDDEALSETATSTGYYSADVVSPDDGYLIYQQAGASPASSDTIVGQVSTVEQQTNTVVDTISGVTAKFAFTHSDSVDANIQRINDVTVTGDGVSPKWGP